MSIGLFLGRFQPLHRGHLLMIKKCAKEVDFLVVGLGSPNAPPSCKNPFTAAERREMIIKVMQESGIRNYGIVELPDMESDEEWAKGVVEAISGGLASKASEARPHCIVPFDIAWSGSEWVLRVFKAQGLPIERIKEFPGFSATKIRRRMAQGLPWLKYIPLSTRKYLREIKAAQRVRTLCAYETTKVVSKLDGSSFSSSRPKPSDRHRRA